MLPLSYGNKRSYRATNGPTASPPPTPLPNPELFHAVHDKYICTLAVVEYAACAVRTSSRSWGGEQLPEADSDSSLLSRRDVLATSFRIYTVSQTSQDDDDDDDGFIYHKAMAGLIPIQTPCTYAAVSFITMMTTNSSSHGIVVSAV